MTTQLELMPACVLPGCRAPVARWGIPCPDCVVAFGPMLEHNPDGRRMTREDIQERDHAVRNAYERQQAAIVAEAAATAARLRAAMPERKANQRCWMCDERRTCTSLAGGWECDTCQVVT